MALLFKPFSIIGGLIAGLIGKKVFELAWSRFDKEEAPDPKHRDTSWKKLGAVLLLQGAIFSVVKGFFDHGARTTFAKLTGTWPGEKKPEQKP